MAAMHAALADAWLYPDGSAHELKQSLATYLGVPAACVTVGNGSNELLLMLAESFMTAHSSAVYSQYGFAIYPLVIRATGARGIEVPALGDGEAMRYGHDLESMARAIAQRYPAGVYRQSEQSDRHLGGSRAPLQVYRSGTRAHSDRA